MTNHSDLIARLRAKKGISAYSGLSNMPALLDEAVIALESLTAENARLKEALAKLLTFYDRFQVSDLNHENAHRAFVGWQMHHDAWEAARAALTEPGL